MNIRNSELVYSRILDKEAGVGRDSICPSVPFCSSIHLRHAPKLFVRRVSEIISPLTAKRARMCHLGVTLIHFQLHGADLLSS
jgi:hypothetical protein